MDRRANNVPLTPGSKTRVLHTNTSDRQRITQTTKQHVPATHVSYPNTIHTQKQHNEKQKQDPGGRKGNESTNQRWKRNSSRPPLADKPSSRSAKESGGTGFQQEGGRRDPFSQPGDKGPDQGGGRENQTKRAPGPIAKHPGPRSAMDLDPGVKMQWAGGPNQAHIQETAGIETGGDLQLAPQNPLVKTPTNQKTTNPLITDKATRFLCYGLPSALGINAKELSVTSEGSSMKCSQRRSCIQSQTLGLSAKKSRNL